MQHAFTSGFAASSISPRTVLSPERGSNGRDDGRVPERAPRAPPRDPGRGRARVRRAGARRARAGLADWPCRLPGLPLRVFVRVARARSAYARPAPGARKTHN